MRCMAKKFRETYRSRIEREYLFLENIIETFKGLIICRDRIYEECMTLYIRSLMKGSKLDFDKFYRKL